MPCEYNRGMYNRIYKLNNAQSSIYYLNNSLIHGSHMSNYIFHGVINARNN